MKSTLKNMVVVLLTITLISSVSVGFVYQLTLEPIAISEAKKKSDAIVEVMPPYETLSEPKKIEFEGNGEPLTLYIGYNGSSVAGYAVETYDDKAYGGKLRLLVGFTPDGTINKVAVISHAETPGLGAKIDDKNSHFVVQFQGKNPNSYKMAVRKDEGDVDAITASTITSKSYINAIMRAHKEVEKLINNAN